MSCMIDVWYVLVTPNVHMFISRVGICFLWESLWTNHLFFKCMQIMGYRSYAEYALHSNMASSPDVVSSFLVELSKTVQLKAAEVLFLKASSSNGFQFAMAILTRYLNGSIWVIAFYSFFFSLMGLMDRNGKRSHNAIGLNCWRASSHSKWIFFL